MRELRKVDLDEEIHMGTVEEKKLKVNSLNWNGGKNKN
jgi:hypothetical protein